MKSFTKTSCSSSQAKSFLWRHSKKSRQAYHWTISSTRKLLSHWYTRRSFSWRTGIQTWQRRMSFGESGPHDWTCSHWVSRLHSLLESLPLLGTAGWALWGPWHSWTDLPKLFTTIWSSKKNRRLRGKIHESCHSLCLYWNQRYQAHATSKEYESNFCYNLILHYCVICFAWSIYPIAIYLLLFCYFYIVYNVSYLSQMDFIWWS